MATTDDETDNASFRRKSRPDSHIDPTTSLNYWSSTTPTVSGMLGGYPQVSAIDLRGSRAFLLKVLRLHWRGSASNRGSSGGAEDGGEQQLLPLVVDCGAGIGRITAGLLRDVAVRIDVVEPVEGFAQVVREMGKGWAEEERVRRGNLKKVRSKSGDNVASPTVASSPGGGNNQTKSKGGKKGKGSKARRESEQRRQRLTSSTSNTSNVSELSDADDNDDNTPEPSSPAPSLKIDTNLSQPARKAQLGTVYVTGLESWVPTPTKAHPTDPKYDLIWNQWCLGHLTDSQLVSYLTRCATYLQTSPPGLIVVKENLVVPGPQAKAADAGFDLAENGDGDGDGDNEDVYDELDSSVTRSERKFKRIFGEAGLRVVREEVQRGFPRGLGLFPVKMWALRPK